MKAIAMSDNLKPCPFCGGSAYKSPGSMSYHCSNCRARGPKINASDADLGWNRRALHLEDLISDDAQQQVDVVATLTLSLPMVWEEEEISTHIRSQMMAAFAADLPASIKDENGNAQSPVNFTFKEEAEIYGNKEYEPGEAPNKPFLVACPGLSNLLFVEEEDPSDAAYTAAQECCELHSYGEAAGVYKVHAIDPLGGCGALLASINVNEEGDLTD